MYFWFQSGLEAPIFEFAISISAQKAALRPNKFFGVQKGKKTLATSRNLSTGFQIRFGVQELLVPQSSIACCANAGSFLHVLMAGVTCLTWFRFRFKRLEYAVSHVLRKN